MVHELSPGNEHSSGHMVMASFISVDHGRHNASIGEPTVGDRAPTGGTYPVTVVMWKESGFFERSEETVICYIYLIIYLFTYFSIY